MSRMTAAGLPSRSTISGALRLVFIPSSDPFSMLMSSRWLLRTDGGNEIVYKLARREAARFARHPARRPGLRLRGFASRLRGGWETHQAAAPAAVIVARKADVAGADVQRAAQIVEDLLGVEIAPDRL